jgi:hypothetical protein
MRKSSDTAAVSAGQSASAGNRWIKCGPPIDLKDMKPHPIRQLVGALKARAGLGKPMDEPLTFDVDQTHDRT